jgi:formate--tetrahydrofolate ligase
MGQTLLPIQEIADRLAIPHEHLELYGRHVAKLRLELLEPRNGGRPGKMILVTAITPTSFGEGKTVTAVGLAQALARIGRTAVVTLREPSLGPFFGVKGGATGGGASQVQPADLINVHSTGDIHAVGSAHNLLAAMLDSHLFHGNALGIDPDSLWWPRSLDMNDRALRHVTIDIGGAGAGPMRETGFVITAASEVMAILALASSRPDLRRRLDSIVVGFRKDGQPVRAGDLQATGAMMVLLNQAIMPNLVQTTEHGPAFIHAGPFGNIAHGTSSVIAQRMALNLAEYVVNETGFGADLGAEKYFDIVMPSCGIVPAAAVLIASVRALNAQGAGTDKAPVTIPALMTGLVNLGKHLDNLATFGVPTIVAINRFEGDMREHVAVVREYCHERGVGAVESEVYVRGGEGGVELAEAVVAAAELPSTPRPLYAPDVALEAKIERVARVIYGAGAVQVEPRPRRMLEQLTALGFGTLPVCMAKTQASISDNPRLYGAPRDFTLTVTDVALNAGAGFVVVVAGNMMRMPGLGRTPQAMRLDVTDAGELVGAR